MERQAGWSLAELATLLGGTLDGPSDHRVLRPAPADEDDPEGLAFAEGAYVERALASGVGAVILPPGVGEGKPAIRHPRPRQAFGHFLALNDRPLPLEEGVSERASVSPLAQIDPTARVGAFAVVEAGAMVGPEARVYPFAYVGESCAVEEGATILPHAVLVKNVVVGARTIVQPGAVLGADGFGFVWDGMRQVKIPQVGGVEIGSDVEIGANTTIDRATAGKTRVGADVKLDNLVQIAHNVRVGAHTVMASQVGIAGSAIIGERCTFAGQAGVGDHMTVGDDIQVGGKSGVVKSVSEPGPYWGFPAHAASAEMRIQSLVRKLPQLVKRLTNLERRFEERER